MYLNPEKRKRKAPEATLPEEGEYILWIDFYELTGIERENDVFLELCIGPFRLPIKSEKLKKDRF
jgi:hypothetical protein